MNRFLLDHILQQWSDYYLRDSTSSLGFSKTSSIAQIGEGRSNQFTAHTPFFNEPDHIQRIDRAVASLPAQHRAVIVISCTQRGTRQQKSQKLGLTLHQYEYLLNLARKTLAEGLV